MKLWGGSNETIIQTTSHIMASDPEKLGDCAQGGETEQFPRKTTQNSLFL